MFVPVSTRTQYPWLSTVASVPLLGGLAMLLLTSWPLAAYLALAEGPLGQPKDAPLHMIIGGVLAGAWAALLWGPLKTQFRVLWIPAPIFYVLLALVMALSK